jgi:ABC-type phosphate transport system ATPase subunit
MSSKLIAIVGPSGTGKSTSIRSLNPKETFIINVARKELPFRGAEKLYNTESKNYMEVDDIPQITALLGTINEKAPHIKNIVLDDAIYSMSFLMMKKANEVGFSKFTNLAKDVTNMLTTARKLRNNLKIFYVTHSETIEDDGRIVGQKIKTIGERLPVLI